MNTRLIVILLRLACAMALVAQFLCHILNPNIVLQNGLLKYFPRHLGKQIWMNSPVCLSGLIFDSCLTCTTLQAIIKALIP